MAIGEFPKTDTRSFTPPMPGEQMDWVLVVDDVARDYPPPDQGSKIVETSLPLLAKKLHASKTIEAIRGRGS